MSIARLDNKTIAWRAAQDIPDGAYVNLGMGIPAVGGAIDQIYDAKRVAVITGHSTKDGNTKLVQSCTLKTLLMN